MASADLKPSDRINIITSINGIDFGSATGGGSDSAKLVKFNGHGSFPVGSARVLISGNLTVVYETRGNICQFLYIENTDSSSSNITINGDSAISFSSKDGFPAKFRALTGSGSIAVLSVNDLGGNSYKITIDSISDYFPINLEFSPVA